MKRATYLVLLLLLVGLAPSAWAGAEEEIAQLTKEWLQAFNAGNIEGLLGQYADTAYLTPSLAPFRIEGKGAIAAFWGGLFQAFPTRSVVLRQPAIRTFNGVTAVSNGYYQMILVDRLGKATNTSGRYSITSVKQEGKWMIVDHHASLVPPAQ